MISNLDELIPRGDGTYTVPKGSRVPDRWKIEANRIRGYYDDGWRTGIDWTHSTPVAKFDITADEFVVATTESGSVYTLYKDREIGCEERQS